MVEIKIKNNSEQFIKRFKTISINMPNFMKMVPVLGGALNPHG